MIPTPQQAKILWQKYNLPSYKQNHVTLVAVVANYLATKLEAKGVSVNKPLLEAAALLHDIDKNISKLPGERHPDAGVRVLREEGMDEVAELVRRHPLHTIYNPELTPETWEAKLLYLSDKMVKSDIITVDERFALWTNEDLPGEAQEVLRRSYPLVKQLETDTFIYIGTNTRDIAENALSAYTTHTR